ncbi:hypothetical protein ElyMa_003734000 [Elysia marginata]|uniref:Cytochrome b5 heme-binding domain-containing protein n=1 Tax=Elysia marginata TaxID=1093978 RepID=A0AAV4F734_9GAST|nr:hypothetical protein ElyMa_003734000 [Elysia marginata]
MGCTRSKVVVPVSAEDGNQTSDQTSSLHTTTEVQNDQSATSTSKDSNKKKNRAKSSKAPLPPINHIDLLPDIELFSSYQSDSADLAVNNAKPRLNCPGIGRAIRLAPIVPGIEQQASGTRTTDSKNAPQSGSTQQCYGDGFNIQTVDQLFTETNSGRASLSNCDSGFFHNRQPPISVSPRNSISRTTMKTGLTPDSSSVFSNYGGSEFSPLNTSRSSFLPASRVNSARTSSVLTTGALNTSFMTSVDGDDDLNMEGNIDLYPLDITDAGSEDDAGSRAATATPKMRLPGDPPGGIATEVGGIGTIVEEYEGGFTPRGPSKDVSINEIKPTPDNKLPHFTPKEIYEHNDRKGSIDWCMYLGKVYDITRLRNTFEPVIVDIQQKKSDCNKNKCETSQDSFSDSDSDGGNKRMPKPVRWDHNSVYNVLRAGLDKNTLNRFLNGCCVGFVVQPDETRFWEDIRSDVRKVLDDLIRADAKDTLSAYCAEYMHLLQRWVGKYRQLVLRPPDNLTGKDLNQEQYPLPEEIARDPEVLREWLDTWVPFDFELPEHGTAWDRLESDGEDETDGSDEADSKEMHPSPNLQELPHFDHSITGEAAWETIAQNLVADDIMTNEQLQTEVSRGQRSNLFNPKSMRCRRLKLMRYFVNKYDLSTERSQQFMMWADTMKKGEEQFLLLCR